MTKKLLYLFFILFSLLDLYLTNHFLNNTSIKEFNPIASFIFSNFGLIGLMIFKIHSIIIFVLCCLILGMKNKANIEKKLLTFGLCLMIFVAFYSWYAISTEHMFFKKIDFFLHQIYYYSHQEYLINYVKNAIIIAVGFLFFYISYVSVKFLFCFFMSYKDTKYDDYEGIDDYDK